eukprot:TRINITY_DN3034_c0_g2_i16.p1 TRINITY_DN3034_c0_g2~~TRINITY_DN3034_c0_g2_i16.p1  ORF type:complete len:190 (+),score=38.92 TRINITY_DN3034_c0_g2_i16:120-689(+)
MSDKRSRRSPTRTRKRSRSPSPDHHSSRPRSPKTKCEDVKIEPEDRKVPKEVPSNRDLSPPRKKRAEDDRETWGKKEEEKEEELDDSDKEKPDFKPSGLLTKELKTRKGVELIYTECEEGRQPNTKWRLYPVKENNTLGGFFIFSVTVLSSLLPLFYCTGTTLFGICCNISFVHSSVNVLCPPCIFPTA